MLSPASRPIPGFPRDILPPEPLRASGIASGVKRGGWATPASLLGTCIRTGSSRQRDLPLLGHVCRNICVPTSHLMCWKYAQEMQILTGAQTKCNQEKMNTRAQNHGT